MMEAGSHLVVLVVEDEWLSRDDMIHRLEDVGCEVLEADAAESALAVLSTGGAVDVLVTDIQLGGLLSGWDVAEAFRARGGELPVIYVSGDTGDRSRQVANSRFLAKPCAPDRVLHAFRDLGWVGPRQRISPR